MERLRYSEFQIGFIRSGAVIYPLYGFVNGLIFHKGIEQKALYMLLCVGTYGLIIAGFTFYNLCKSFCRR